ncbi:hypothetical protein Tco_1512547, partial [Tanacetum coccineum]
VVRADHASKTQTSDFDTCELDCSVETQEPLPEPTVNEPKVVSQPKVWSDAPIIEEYESDSEDEHVSLPTKEHETPIALTRTGKIPVNTARASGTNTVNTARHNVNRLAVPTNAAMKVNTVKPIVNNARPKSDFHKSVSPFRRPFNRTTTLRTNFSKQKVNTTEDYPHRALQNKGIVDSGCSKHMTGNKAYLAEYQDFNGGPITFGGSKGYITGKDEGTVDQTEGRSTTPTTPTTTPTIFGDDETIAQVLINMSQAKAVSREKEKGVELKDVEETERPRPTSTRSLLTLKPLPKIDPKDKGKKKIEEEDESDTESEGIPEAEKKFKQLARDEEMASDSSDSIHLK